MDIVEEDNTVSFNKLLCPLRRRAWNNSPRQHAIRRSHFPCNL